MMTTERTVRLVAGSMILTSVALARFVSPWFLLWTLFVGANLFQSSLTGCCPLETVLRKLGFKDAGACCAPPQTPN